jgi:RNA polymerase-binding protein DksA
MPENNLSKDQLFNFKQRLLHMKKEIEAKVSDWDSERVQDTSRDQADFSNHPADLGTAQFEQERAAGFKMMYRDQLREIDDALERIEDGTYGFSTVSGKSIPVERLEAVPTATKLVEE